MSLPLETEQGLEATKLLTKLSFSSGNNLLVCALHCCL